jgi:pyrroline-5-carboxylate reductase
MNGRENQPKAARVALLGAGRMGFALVSGWLKRGIPGSSIQVIDPAPSPQLSELIKKSGSVIVDADHACQVDVLVLAVKPQIIAGVAEQARTLLGPGALVLSIMAGTTIAELRLLFSNAGSIIRAMPNLAASIGQGTSVVVAEPTSTADHRGLSEQLLGAVGSIEWLSDEALMDAATALSGSGPAYVFYATECLARAGYDLGLPADTAARLARATVQGSGALLGALPESPEQLRQLVTSPGGTTAAGLEVLMADERLQELLRATLESAARRSRELGTTAAATRSQELIGTNTEQRLAKGAYGQS